MAVSIYLLKGVRLQGTIGGFDPYVMTLKRDGQEQLIYKHGIATLTARIDAELLDGSGASGEGMQQAFLDRAVGQAVDAFLLSGVRLNGKLVAHDRYTVILDGGDGELQLIYKHALSSLSGARR
ncbi:RNA chaperone Hfq [Sphingomicrobium sp. B8]|uniref:RNA chaperone Hfq n=1 Tax=Sphingomicrobium clamense TaxID=2851013 RepID=A0ABS6V7G2_9SPHN|nr:RNA chaperone Hfq [Sphingomicrobium sp. B8]